MSILTALSKSASIKKLKHLPKIDDKGIRTTEMFFELKNSNVDQKKSRFSEPEIVHAYAQVIVNSESVEFVNLKDMRLDAAATTTFLTAYG